MTLLIFDIDGTLTDTKEVDDHCFISAFKDEFSVELPSVDWATFTNVTDYGLFLDLYTSAFHANPSESDRFKFQTRFFDYLNRELSVNATKFKAVLGASKFMEHCLEQVNFKAAYATGGWGTSAKMKLTAASISYSNIPLSSCDHSYRRQDILLEAIEQSKRQYGIENFDSVVYFGDGEWDYKTTSELQIPFVGVDINNDKKLRKLGVPTIINDFTNITEIFSLLERTA